MATITLKGIPPTLHRTLKQRATVNRRSLNQEVLSTLESTVGTRRADTERLLAEAERFRNSLHFIALPEEIDEAKREGRE